MHPILSHRRRLLVYLAAWLAFGLLLAGVIAVSGPAAFPWAAAFAAPLALLLGLMSLSCWYLVRLLPAGTTALPRMARTWLAAGVVDLAIWIALAHAWSWVLGLAQGAHSQLPAASMTPLLLFAGCIGLSVAVLGYYMLAAFQTSREAQQRALELRMAAREAEMQLLRRQIDPHFLFNSLNSVAALIGTDAAAARRMCFLLADFFRRSVKLGACQTIALADELALAGAFLAIEEVRFGARLRSRVDATAEAGAVGVPALILQPLVENAVHHGIAHLLEGGDITVAAATRDGLLDITVENACDPDRPPSRGTGTGLANVRGRLMALYGTQAVLDVDSRPGCFQVRMRLPAAPARETPCAS